MLIHMVLYRNSLAWKLTSVIYSYCELFGPQQVNLANSYMAY